MTLRQLRLLNFRRFHKVTLEFPENVIGIIGRNGAGKSTLLEAIAWALYGSRTARTEKLLIKRQQASPRDLCEVELAFTVGGESYKVVRSLRGASGTVEAGLYGANQTEPMAVNESGVNKAIEELIGLEYKTFEVSIFARQKELAALSTMTDEPRRKMVGRLINLEAIDIARQKVSADALQKRKFLEGARASQVDMEDLQKQRALQIARQEEAEKSLQQKQAEEQRLAREQEKARRLLEEESQRRDRFLKLRNEVSTMQGQCRLLQQQKQQAEDERKEILKEKTRVKELEPVRHEWQQLKQEKDDLEQKRRSHLLLEGKQQLAKNLTDQIAELQNESGKLQQALAPLQALATKEKDLNARMHIAQSDLQTRREEEKRILAEMSGIESRGRDLKEKMAGVQKLGPDSPCPVCTRPLREHYEPVVAHFEEQLEGLRTRYRELSLLKTLLYFAFCF